MKLKCLLVTTVFWLSQQADHSVSSFPDQLHAEGCEDTLLRALPQADLVECNSIVLALEQIGVGNCSLPRAAGGELSSWTTSSQNYLQSVCRAACGTCKSSASNDNWSQEESAAQYKDHAAEDWYLNLEAVGCRGHNLTTPPVSFSLAEYKATLCDNTPTYVQAVQPKYSKPEAVLVFLYGRNEYMEKYKSTVFEMIGDRPWITLFYDQRGQGRANGARGHLRSFDDSACDLDAVLRQAVAPEWRGLPVFALGHGAGGGVLARYLQLYRGITAAVLLSPVFSLTPSEPAELCDVVKILAASNAAASTARAARYAAPLPWDERTQTLSDNASAYDKYHLTPAYAACGDFGPPTLGYVAAACELLERLFDAPDNTSAPWKVVMGAEDNHADVATASALCAMSASCQLPALLQTSFHELLLHTDELRQAAQLAAINFFTAYLPACGSGTDGSDGGDCRAPASWSEAAPACGSGTDGSDGGDCRAPASWSEAARSSTGEPSANLTCTERLRGMEAACAVPGSAECCASLTEFNDNLCWCSAEVVEAGGEQLQGVKGLETVCGWSAKYEDSSSCLRGSNASESVSHDHTTDYLQAPCSSPFPAGVVGSSSYYCGASGLGDFHLLLNLSDSSGCSVRMQANGFEFSVFTYDMKASAVRSTGTAGFFPYGMVATLSEDALTLTVDYDPIFSPALRFTSYLERGPGLLSVCSSHGVCTAVDEEAGALDIERKCACEEGFTGGHCEQASATLHVPVGPEPDDDVATLEQFFALRHNQPSNVTAIMASLRGGVYTEAGNTGLVLDPEGSAVALHIRGAPLLGSSQQAPQAPVPGGEAFVGTEAWDLESAFSDRLQPFLDGHDSAEPSDWNELPQFDHTRSYPSQVLEWHPAPTTIIDCQFRGRFLTLLNGARLTLERLHVQRCNATTVTMPPLPGDGLGGALVTLDSTLVLRDLIFSHNLAVYKGAAVYIDSGVHTWQRVLFLENHVTQGYFFGSVAPGRFKMGGAVHMDHGELHASQCLFEANSCAHFGGGLAATNVRLQLDEVQMVGNLAAFDGGAVFLQYTFYFVADRLELRQNLAGSKGGGVFFTSAQLDANDQLFVLNNSLIMENGAVDSGGGGYLNDLLHTSMEQAQQVKGPKMLIEATHIVQNRAHGGAGGGLMVLGSSVEITGATLANNTAAEAGGALSFRSSLALLASARVSWNRALSGAGLSVLSLSNLTVAGTLLEGNTAAREGGAIRARDAAVTVRDSSLAWNTAEEGGGIHVAGSTTADIVSVVLDCNEARGTGGAAFLQSFKAISVFDCHVADNVAEMAGGMYLDPSQATSCTLKDTQLMGNTAMHSGGGLLIEGKEDPDIHNRSRYHALRVRRNQAVAGGGGGIFTAAPLELEASFVRGNVAYYGNEYAAPANVVRLSRAELNVTSGVTVEAWSGAALDIFGNVVRTLENGVQMVCVDCAAQGLSVTVLGVDSVRFIEGLVTFTEMVVVGLPNSTIVMRVGAASAGLQTLMSDVVVHIEGCDAAHEVVAADGRGCVTVRRECPPGFFMLLVDDGMTGASCVACSLNFYNSDWSYATSCSMCPRNSEGTTLASASITSCHCVPGWYSDPAMGLGADPFCLECPDGATCPGGAVVIGDADFWRKSLRVYEFYKCASERCLGEGGGEVEAALQLLAQPECWTAVCEAPFSGTCRLGHEGLLCASCLEGYAMQGMLCEECTAGLSAFGALVMAGIAAMAVAGVFAFAFLPVLTYLRRKAQEEREERLERMKSRAEGQAAASPGDSAHDSHTVCAAEEVQKSKPKEAGPEFSLEYDHKRRLSALSRPERVGFQAEHQQVGEKRRRDSDADSPTHTKLASPMEAPKIRAHAKSLPHDYRYHPTDAEVSMPRTKDVEQDEAPLPVPRDRSATLPSKLKDDHVALTALQELQRLMEGIRAFLIKSGIHDWLRSMYNIMEPLYDDLVFHGFSLFDLWTDYFINIVSYLQVANTMKFLYDIEWPSVMESLFAFTRLVTLAFPELPAVSCLFRGVNYYTSFLIWMFSPLVFALSLKLTHTFIFPVLMRDPVAIKLSRHCALKLQMFLNYLLYIPLSQQCIMVFSCKEIYGAHYLTADLNIQCYTEQHYGYMLLGAVCFIVYPLGIPASYVLMLRQFQVPQLYRQKYDKAVLHEVGERFASEHLLGMASSPDVMVWTREQLEVMYDRLLVSRTAEYVIHNQSTKADLVRSKTRRESKVQARVGKTNSFSSFSNLGKMTRPDSFSSFAGSSSADRSSRQVQFSGTQEVFLSAPSMRYSLESIPDDGADTKNVSMDTGDAADSESLSIDEMKARIICAAKRNVQLTEAVQVTWSMPSGIAMEELSQEQRLEKKALLSVSFLFSAYKPRFWWWEIVECVRKFVLTCAMMFIAPGTDHQIICSCLINFVMVCMYMLIQPNASVPSLYMKIFVSIILFYSFFVGFGISQDAMNGDGWVYSVLFLNYVLVVVPGLFGVMMLLTVVHSMYKAKRKRKENQDDTNGDNEDDVDVDTDFLSGD
ncbi:hypothetical protein CYMTET_12021 [Cymbomonas tetramitiformis]|uniref:EGF-like domain-containing protein n=1 Tax=Cymbomonas tetramitiformis TaxID=36881 RepID=A0AAE0LC94_9CHLO|nr:hypothetical protein CYMTET_12021 [Cymbomonas tetramitiformis]